MNQSKLIGIPLQNKFSLGFNIKNDLNFIQIIYVESKKTTNLGEKEC